MTGLQLLWGNYLLNAFNMPDTEYGLVAVSINLHFIILPNQIVSSQRVGAGLICIPLTPLNNDANKYALYWLATITFQITVTITSSLVIYFQYFTVNEHGSLNALGNRLWITQRVLSRYAFNTWWAIEFSLTTSQLLTGYKKFFWHLKTKVIIENKNCRMRQKTQHGSELNYNIAAGKTKEES